MFNKDFYPTPIGLIQKMWNKLDREKRGLHILEPSAGKGDIVKFILDTNKNYRQKIEYDIDCIEFDSQLQKFLLGSKYNLVYDDFLNFHTTKVYNCIMMNPPFSQGAKHLLKAIDLLHAGGQIVCLLNAETIINPFSNERKDLANKLQDLDASVEFLSSEFENAERKTSVQTALVYVKIDAKESFSFVFDAMEKAKEQNIFRNSDTRGYLTSSDFINRFIEMFNYEATIGKQLILEYRKLLPYIQSEFKKDGGKSNPILTLGLFGKDSRYRDTAPDYNEYLEKLRYKYWKLYLNSDELSKLCTNDLRQTLHAKLDELKSYDFNLFNVKNVMKMINSELTQSVENNILKLFDKFTIESTYCKELSKNIHLYNGWKTNKAFYINKKVIINLYGFSEYWWRCFDSLNDIELAYQYLDNNKDTRVQIDLRETLKEALEKGITKKIETTYFYLDFYKKGTCHITFKDQDLLFKFNVFGSQKKGWLPFGYGKKDKKKFNQDEVNVVETFQKLAGIDYDDVVNNQKKYIYENSTLLQLE